MLYYPIPPLPWSDRCSPFLLNPIMVHSSITPSPWILHKFLSMLVRWIAIKMRRASVFSPQNFCLILYAADWLTCPPPIKVKLFLFLRVHLTQTWRESAPKHPLAASPADAWWLTITDEAFFYDYFVWKKSEKVPPGGVQEEECATSAVVMVTTSTLIGWRLGLRCFGGLLDGLWHSGDCRDVVQQHKHTHTHTYICISILKHFHHQHN